MKCRFLPCLFLLLLTPAFIAAEEEPAVMEEVTEELVEKEVLAEAEGAADGMAEAEAVSGGAEDAAADADDAAKSVAQSAADTDAESSGEGLESDLKKIITYEQADSSKNSPALTFFSESYPDFYPAEVKKVPVRKEISLASEEILARPDVEKFRRQYLSPKWAAALRTYLENAMEYRLYVRKAVEDAGVPEVLEYLPVVESNYKTSAKSKSGAIGMWQFMANSVWPFLTLNDYVDERLDPWKSTDAAIKKLQDNYKVFDDWLLAIAAYNCGMGALNRVIKKAGGEKDFWYLADNNLLPAQTADYVPKLLAIADLAINSEYYGINLPSHEEEFEVLENEKNGNFDYISVNKAYSLNQLAQEMRMDTATLRRLNPSYLLGMTHPSKTSEIRLPLGMKQSALDALEKVEPIEFPMKYTVTAGDSLWSISRRFKVTVKALCELNNIEENAILKIGKTLYIPAK